jgi:two-component sensor histidine kinase
MIRHVQLAWRNNMMKAALSDVRGYLSARAQGAGLGAVARQLADACLTPIQQWLRVDDQTGVSGKQRTGAKRLGTRREATRRIERLEAEVAYRQLLLEEVIHRTKNALQRAVAILDEQIDAVADAWVRRDLRNIQKQLRTLSRVHNEYYGQAWAESGGLNLRLSEVCSSVFNSFGERSGRIALSISVADIQLDRHQEISLSLILDELLTNILKHAFPSGRRGTVAVSVAYNDLGMCNLLVRDDGVGRHLTDRGSTGLALVRAFAQALGGRLDITSHGGTTARVSFPLRGDASERGVIS